MRKRIESLEGQVKASIELLGRVLEENEYLASVACGFAWDMVVYCENPADCPHFLDDIVDTPDAMGKAWAKAVEEASK